jgi:nucleoside-diphosphate-sugar epimerase
MRYLVTGGAGFIGTNLVKQLKTLGHEVRVLDNYIAGRHVDRVVDGIEYIEGDIRNIDDMKKAHPELIGFVCERSKGKFELDSMEI